MQTQNLLENLPTKEVLLMEKSSLHGDNQQATPIELSYLAGLWDGEGSFCITKMKSHGNYGYYSKSSIVNTNMAIIAKIVEILDKINVGGFLQQMRHRNPRHSDSIVISVQKMTKNLILLKALLPYLCGKKPHAELMLRFINRRLEAQKNQPKLLHGENGCITKCIREDGYSEEDVSLYEQLRILNRKGSAPETTNGHLYQEMVV